MDRTANLHATLIDDKTRARVAVIAAYFLTHPDIWISAFDLMPLGGTLSWRSRLADCRKSPYHLVIRNRQRKVVRPDGVRVTCSEYRYESTATVIAVAENTVADNGAADDAWALQP